MKTFMCFFIAVLFFAHPVIAAPVAATKPADAAAQSQGKLDKILQNQLEILKQLDEIKKELAIVKARATR